MRYIIRRLSIIRKGQLMRNNGEKMKIEKKFSIIFYFLKKMWDYKKIFFLIFSFYITFMIIQPLVNVFFPRMIIEEICSGNNNKRIIMFVSILISTTFIINTLVALFDNHLSKIYYEDFNRLLEAGIGKKSMELKYSATEDKKTLDYINDAKLGINNAYSGGMTGFFKAFSLFVSNCAIMLVTVIVVVKYSPILILIVILNVIINTFVSNKQNDIKLSQFNKQSQIERAYFYLLHTLSDIKYGKDIRLFNARKMMIDRADGYNLEQAKIGKALAEKTRKYVIISQLDMAFTTVITYFVLSMMTLKHQINIGEFTMLATSVATLVLSMNNILQQVLNLNKFVKYADKYVEFIEKNTHENTGIKECVYTNGIKIEFKNVSFKYPNQSEYALRNINMTICDNDHLSIVGLNGAGKSTFIKLLCRLYECTEGEILLNGTNILEYDYESYIRYVAAVFQDFNLLNFSIKENIIADNPDKVSDEMIQPLIDEVGLRDKIESLPLGIHTPVFRYYDMRGFEPSGGEQQKIAIARALYKNSPILILDEPTAALDPIAEKEVYERFNEMTDGKIAIFISHRLASCKFCKNILVFNNGEIVERGVHDELIKSPDGLYSKMFKAQEKYYSA